MGKFLESERRVQVRYKATAPYFSISARADGVYRQHAHPFCLPLDHAEENLLPQIRETALAWFADHGIKWHDGRNGKPGNHLCDSQVCCVNFLYPFADQPAVLKQLLIPVFPEIKNMLPVEDGLFVSFEWIGAHNYLGEKMSRGARRTRGANFTSADAIVLFERNDLQRQIVLIEWKYTESYGSKDYTIADSGTDRRQIYRHLIDQADCPIDLHLIPSFDSLFFEPFYQFMRQQLLAHQMEKARELGTDRVSLLHICPARNIDFRRVTSPDLTSLGKSATEVWKKLVKPRNRFISIHTEELFDPFLQNPPAEMHAWAEYILRRYPWVTPL